MTAVIATALVCFPAGYLAGAVITSSRMRRSLRSRPALITHLAQIRGYDGTMR